MEPREVPASTIAVAIVKFLRSPRASANLSPDAAEGLEVAAQCLETAYGIDRSQTPQRPVPDLSEMFRAHEAAAAAASAVAPAAAAFVSAAATAFPGPGAPSGATFTAGPFVVPGFPLAQSSQRQEPQQQQATPASAEVKARADSLKNEGNTLMKESKHAEALQKYTEAIALDSTNAIYFCNRAAAHSSMKNNEAAIEDCRQALTINPKYGRAYGRLGLALTNLNRHTEAREAYKIACQLEPDNEAYRNNLAVTEETLASQSQPRAPSSFGVDIGSLLQNPTLTNVATQILSDPGLQNFMGRLFGELGTGGGGRPGEPAPAEGADPNGGLNILLQAGQQLAQQMQQANPELIEQLRRQMSEGDRPPPSSDPRNPPGNPQ